ncbi:MAG: hypothetical protein IJE16_01375 [Ruminococcus sp.]|nr:hypothetical protein [Ruminococcus sp.]
MKGKIIIALVVLLILAVIIGVVYYVKNIMIVRDKDGMVYDFQDNVTTQTETKDD